VLEALGVLKYQGPRRIKEELSPGIYSLKRKAIKDKRKNQGLTFRIESSTAKKIFCRLKIISK
jgi:hypothetical protein